MELIICNASGTPFYEQVYQQLKTKIISGELRAGESLPSIRGLAKDLRISVITTKRAYDELESDGYIYTVAGKGSFVAEKNLELIRETNLRQIEAYMQKIIALAVSCRLSDDEVVQMLQLMQEGNTHEHN